MAQWNAQANDIFVRAAEVESPAERQRFLDQQCGPDLLQQHAPERRANNDEMGEAIILQSAGELLPMDSFALEPSIGDFKPVIDNRIRMEHSLTS